MNFLDLINSIDKNRLVATSSQKLQTSNILIDQSNQNISQENIRTIMTRLGRDSKMIFLGDERQQDSKGHNGLTFLMDHFMDIDEIGCVQFNKSDVVRNPLIAKIERVFDSLQT